MKLLSQRSLLVAFMFLLSGLSYHLLGSFALRMLFASIPALLGVQLTLADTLESIIMSRVAGRKWWFIVFLAPGTILHELSHLVAAIVTGCRIEKVSLFSPNPRTGVLGYVSYSRPKDKWLVFREFIVGFAPFFGCGLVLFSFNILLGSQLSAMLYAPSPHDLPSYASFAGSVMSSMAGSASSLPITSPYTWAFLYLQFCFGIGAAPSSVDFSGAFSSLRKNVFSALLFAATLSAIVYMSDGRYALWGYEADLADWIGYAAGFTAIVLLLSNILLAFAIPLSYVALKMMDIRGIAKTIPLTSAFISFIGLADHISGQYAAAASGTICFSSLLLLLRAQKKSGDR